MQQPSFTITPQGRNIAYEKMEGRSPTILFCTGFKSDMTGSKALALEAFARAGGQAFVRFDYSGHGQSGSAFEDGCISDWREDALHVLDALTTGLVVLVGSSMGAWIALLLAIARPERIRGLVGVAAAPDFTERLIWQQFTDAQRAEMAANGRVAVPNCYGDEPYIITQKLIEDGRKHLLLHAPIPVSCPIRLLHGTADADVPWQISREILEKAASTDAQLTLIKNGNHRLSAPNDIELISGAVFDLLA